MQDGRIVQQERGRQLSCKRDLFFGRNAFVRVSLSVRGCFSGNVHLPGAVLGSPLDVHQEVLSETQAHDHDSGNRDVTNSRLRDGAHHVCTGGQAQAHRAPDHANCEAHPAAHGSDSADWGRLGRNHECGAEMSVSSGE